MSSWINRAKPRLPMYKSRFRRTGTFTSAADVRNGLASELLRDSDQDVKMQSLRSPFRTSQFESFLWNDLFMVACELHSLSYLLDLHLRQPSNIGSQTQEYFEDTFAGVMNSLASFSYPDSEEFMKSSTYYRQHCWRISAMAYIDVALRTWDPALGVGQTPQDMLISSLRLSDMSSKWSPFADILLWVLFIGICGARAVIERSWLLLEFKSVVTHLGLKSFEELKASLDVLLYRETIFNRKLLEIWNDINA